MSGTNANTASLISNSSLLERHKAVLPSWMTLYYEDPIEIVGGEGRTVWDAQGRKYLDCFGGILTTMTGYGVKPVVEAIQDQAGKMLHTSTLYLIESQIELAERIAEESKIPNAKVFFTSSGSEANDAALMLATSFRQSNHVLAMRHSYHGRSLATVPVTGNASWSPSSLSPFQVSYIHGSYKYRSPFRHMSDADYIDACAHDLENMLEVSAGGNVACLLAEPILGVGGFAIPPAGLFGRFKSILEKQGILFIADEVQTGWGRTGENFWGYQAHDFLPDMITFAKGLGNGLAIGGVVGRPELIDCFTANSISTFGGNPLATRGALANLQYLDDENLQENSRIEGAFLLEELQKIQTKYPFIGDVRGKGLMIGIEFVDPETEAPDTATTTQIMELAKGHGVLLGKGGFYGNVIRLTPPLSLTREEGKKLLDVFKACLAAL